MSLTITGTPYRYHNETLEEAFASRKAEYSDTPDWQIEAWVSTYTAIAKGELATVSDDLQKLLERTPRPLQNSPKSPKFPPRHLGDFS